MINRAFIDAALALRNRGLRTFPVDNPDQAKCIGAHVKIPCDGIRGKHPSVAWGTWARVATDEMIEQAWTRHDRLANIGISCGPSNLVVLDEDAHGELDRWCTDNGITLPETYTVTTSRGRHLYFHWGHSAQPIGNCEKALKDYKINVRGHGGMVVGEYSKHESGAIYTGNGKPIVGLPQEVADKLLAATPPPRSPTSGSQSSFFRQQATGDPNATMIPDGKRHPALVEYAGWLRGLSLDYHEAEAVFRVRWLLCEQPDGEIPEARFHTSTCRFPVTWDEAKTELADVYNRYPPGAGTGSTTGASTKAGSPKRWKASDLKSVAQQRFLAKNRISRGAVTILCGDEGIGKSLLWVLIVDSRGQPIQRRRRMGLIKQADDCTRAA